MKMKNFRSVLVSKVSVPLLCFANLSACGVSPSSLREAWNRANNPLNLAADYVTQFASLPASGSLEVQPWSDTYWPSYRGGLASRWRDEAVDSFSYQPPTREELTQMTLLQKSKLSPAEKYDIFVGRYDYPLVAEERSRTSPDRPGWEGLCHGWAPASLHFAEPHAVLVTSPDGIEIPFASSDIEALLTFYTGQKSFAPWRNLGDRCNVDLARDPESAVTSACRDTNAGAFHVVLANQIALKKQGFIADVRRDVEVWNQPIFAFESTTVGEQAPTPGAAPGTVKEMLIETTMHYGAETAAHWAHYGPGPASSSASRTYHYRVELNAEGQVIGGDWNSEDRPDFLWTKDKPEFAGDYAPLQELYLHGINGPVLEEPVE